MIEIQKKKEKTYEFVFRNDTGNPLFNSISYPNKTKAKEALKSLTNHKTLQISFERKTNHSGEFLFSLKTKKSGIIGNSQLYQSEAGMENGIKNLINRINYLSDQNQQL